MNSEDRQRLIYEISKKLKIEPSQKDGRYSKRALDENGRKYLMAFKSPLKGDTGVGSFAYNEDEPAFDFFIGVGVDTYDPDVVLEVWRVKYRDFMRLLARNPSKWRLRVNDANRRDPGVEVLFQGRRRIGELLL